MSQEGSNAVGDALIAVARFRVGRILMWIVATPFLFVGSLGFFPSSQHALNGGRFFGGLFGIGAILVFFALVGAWRERRASRPSPIRGFLIRLALAGIIMGGAALLSWLLNRRSQAALTPPPAPPRPEDVDRLCAAQELVG